MTDYEYDKDLPYVVVTVGNEMAARFRLRDDAEHYTGAADDFLRVIDTTPKPRVPDDARYITWLALGVERHVARYWGGESRKWAEIGSLIARPLEDLPGVTPDTVFTVLEERKNDD